MNSGPVGYKIYWVAIMIIWLKKAKQNLADELEFIHKEDPSVAMRIAKLVKSRVESLEQFPEKGRIGRVASTRELVFPEIPYIIPYRVQKNDILILRFFHSSRKLPRKW